MRVLKAEAENFASYANLSFDFTNQGLTLIQGVNGAGKSTLCDIIPWALFGQTAKGGTVSEVLSWPGDKPCKVTLFLENTTICRIRGKAKDNDLYWDQGQGPQHGKDLIDTQRLINSLLGFTYDTYMAGAYYHEFSQTAQFFSTTAKNRREITEELVDLSLAVSLQAKTQDAKKALTKELTSITAQLDRTAAQLSATTQALMNANARSERWAAEQETITAMVASKAEKFERDREIDLNEVRRAIQTHKSLIQPLPDTDLYPKCPTCGHPTDSPEIRALRHQNAVNDKSIQRIEILSEKIKEIKLRINPHKTEIVETINPYIAEIKELEQKVTKLSATEGAAISHKEELEMTLEDLNLLQDVVMDYRIAMVGNAIQGLEDTTNALLSDHFDAEIRVAFSAEDADKLNVDITKDGNACSYTQLSKGQRCVLKLCFGIAVMKAVALHSSVNFRQIFLDEALDGMSDAFKLKAFSLLSTLALSYESVFCVDHSDAFKACFDNVYTATLVNGVSEIG